jgi:D-tyrosyl-tRNA(Tyr) deacylase
VGAIGPGLLALVGIARGDSDATVDELARKTAELRIFSDAEGRFNLNLIETGGACLVVSQFTLLGDTSKGRRPNFLQAAPPDDARHLVDRYAATLRRLGVPVETGEFGAHMEVSLVNDGPVTLILERQASSAGGVSPGD